MGSEDQSLTVHSKKIRRDYHQPKGNNSHQKGNSIKPNKDLSKLRCYTCDEKGHFARECPRRKNISHNKKGNKKINHAHAAKDDEPFTKRIKQESDDSSSDQKICSDFLSHGNYHTWKQCLAYIQWCFQTYDGIQRILCETI